MTQVHLLTDPLYQMVARTPHLDAKQRRTLSMLLTKWEELFRRWLGPHLENVIMDVRRDRVKSAMEIFARGKRDILGAVWNITMPVFGGGDFDDDVKPHEVFNRIHALMANYPMPVLHKAERKKKPQPQGESKCRSPKSSSRLAGRSTTRPSSTATSKRPSARTTTRSKSRSASKRRRKR